MRCSEVKDAVSRRHIETGTSNFDAYVLDLSGCVAAGETCAKTSKLIHKAIAFHLEGMQADGLPVPEPNSSRNLVEMDA